MMMMMMAMREKMPKLLHFLTNNPRSSIITLFSGLSVLNLGLWLKLVPPKAMTKKKNCKKRCGVAVRSELFSLVSRVLLSLHAFHSVKNGECVYLYEHHIERNRSKKNICYIVCNLHVWRQHPRAGGASPGDV